LLCRGSLRPENYFRGSSRVKILRKAGIDPIAFDIEKASLNIT
jgi:hypothetical protein